MAAEVTDTPPCCGKARCTKRRRHYVFDRQEHEINGQGRSDVDSVINRIDQELSSSIVVRSGMSAYAMIVAQYERLAKRDRAAADRQLERSVVDLAARQHWQSSGSRLFGGVVFDSPYIRTVRLFVGRPSVDR